MCAIDPPVLRDQIGERLGDPVLLQLLGGRFRQLELGEPPVVAEVLQLVPVPQATVPEEGESTKQTRALGLVQIKVRAKLIAKLNHPTRVVVDSLVRVNQIAESAKARLFL